MPEEILNLDYHVKRLLLKALNKYRYKTQAYCALGISEKQLYNLIKKYNVKLAKGGVYVISEQENISNGKPERPVH